MPTPARPLLKRSSASGARELSTLARAVEARAADLLRLPNVHHVGIGNKTVRGLRLLHQLAIVFFVWRKLDPAKEEERIPAQIEVVENGARHVVPTDVVELEGRPGTFSIRGSDIVRGYDGEVGLCTFAFIGRDEAGYAVTNAHVVASVRHRDRTGPAYILQSGGGRDVVASGAVALATPLWNAKPVVMDAALVRLDAASVPLDSWRIEAIDRRIARIDTFKAGDRDPYYFVADGRTHRCEEPVFVPVSKPIPVGIEGGFLPYANFWKLKVREGSSRKGQSGVLVFRLEGDAIVAAGIGFGGIDPGEIWAFAARDMWRALGLGRLAP